MRVFLTGGTGLLGSHLAEELVSLGYETVALVRPTSDTRFLRQIGVQLVTGTVSDSSAHLASLMQGCTRVVHGAALVYAGGGWEPVRAVNVQGTEHVLTAAAEAGVTKVVHISSVAAYGTVDEPPDEDEPLTRPLPDGDHYARSKREAEDVARRIERERGLPTTIVRPSAVYGERDRLMAPAIARMLRLPLVPLIGPGTNTLPVVYAGNVARAIRLALESPAGGDTYDLGRDHPLTQQALFELQGEGMGRTPRFVRIPAGGVRGVAGVLTRLGVGAPGAKHLPIDRVARLALGENPYHSHRAHSELGWAPPHRHEDALVRTGRWLAGRA